MKTVFLLTIFAILFICTTHANQLRPFRISESERSSLTPGQLIDLIAESQPQIMKKAVKHYLNQEAEALQKTYSPNAVKQQLCNWFKENALPKKMEQLDRYIHSKLFYRLDMGKLSESFKQEIDNNPEAYFLNYEMYDLLIDE